MDRKTEKHILNVLRQGTVTWGASEHAINRFRKHVKVGKYKNGKDKFVYKYQCQECMEWFRRDEVEKDHEEEVGSFTGDWNDYISRMYNADILQPLCIVCHKEKTTTFNAALMFERNSTDL